MPQDSHRGDVVHAVRRNVALLVTIEPGEGEATTRRVVCSPSGLTADPRRYGGLILQPVAQRRRGELALVPVSHRGEKGERAAEEPCQVDFRRLLCRRIYANVQVRYPMRRCSDHVYGRCRGESAASQDRGVEVAYAIPTMAPFLVRPEGSHRCLGVRYQPEQSWLLRQNTPSYCASLRMYDRSIMASPSWEVPTPEATWVW